MKYLLCLLLLFSAASAQTQYWGSRPSVPQPESLVAYWGFDGVATDSISSTNNLTAVGSPTYVNSMTGFGTCDTLNGSSQYFQKKDTVGFARSSGTITAWIFKRANGFSSIIGSADTLTGTSFLYLGTSTANESLQYAWRVGGGLTTSSSKFGTLSLNTWYHIAVTFTATSGFLYVNGKDYGSSIPTNIKGWSTINTRDNVNIGSSVRSTVTSIFPGKIDQVLVYRYILTPAQIKQLYNQGKTLHLQGTKQATAPASNDTIFVGAKAGVAPTNNVILSGISGDSLWPVKDSLIAHWRFNNNGTDEKGGYTATLSGGATYKTGMAGFAQCCTLDGVNDSVTVADNNIFSFTAGGGVDLPFSISMWVYVIDNINFPFVAKNRAGAQEYIFGLSSQGKIYCKLIDTGTDELGVYKNTAFTEGIWTHVVLTYNGLGTSYTNLKIYINAVTQVLTNYSSGTYSGMSNTAAPVQIGWNIANYGQGSIDAVSIYRRKLTDGEVKQIYDKAKYGYESR